MLTKEDLRAIDQIVTRGVDGVVTKRVDQIVTKIIGDALRPVWARFSVLESEIKKVNKLLHTVIDLFDKDIVELQKKVDRIEGRMGIVSN